MDPASNGSRCWEGQFISCLLTDEQGIDASVFTAGRMPDMRSIDSIVSVPGLSGAQPDSSAETRRQQEQRASKSQTHTTSKFCKEELGSARVIGQVDGKFVACSLPSDSRDEGEPVLVLIDQHAADERVRVERFLMELCNGAIQGGAESTVLDALKGVVLTKDEATLSQQEEVLQELRRWGFHVGRVAIMESLTVNWVQVDVLAVPALLRDKVRLLTSPYVASTKGNVQLLQGDELQNLLKGCLAKYRVEGCPRWSHALVNELSENEWLRALKLCPRELVELVNSKACRGKSAVTGPLVPSLTACRSQSAGAIMFNDKLELDQCERLVHQLSKTVFPFQCAHGRPSMVPLTILDVLGSSLRPTRHRNPPEWTNLMS